MAPDAVQTVAVAAWAVKASMSADTASAWAVAPSAWAVASSVSDVAASVHDAQVLCGLLQSLRMMRRHYVDCCILCVGCHILCVGCF